MKLKDGFVLEEVGGTFIAVAVGQRAEEFKIMIKLNSTGAFLWKTMAQRNVTEGDLLRELLASYSVSEDIARRDVAAFVKTLSDGGLLDE